jgi:hypothetical protein
MIIALCSVGYLLIGVFAGRIIYNYNLSLAYTKYLNQRLNASQTEINIANKVRGLAPGSTVEDIAMYEAKSYSMAVMNAGFTVMFWPLLIPASLFMIGWVLAGKVLPNKAEQDIKAKKQLELHKSEYNKAIDDAEKLGLNIKGLKKL